MPPLLVTAAIVIHNNKILLTRRPLDKPLGGQWEFPGGKLEDNESPIGALQRELREETGLEIFDCRIFEVIHHHYAWGPLLLLAYCCCCHDPHVHHYQISDHAWLEPQQLTHYDILPADHELVQKLVREFHTLNSAPPDSAHSV